MRRLLILGGTSANHAELRDLLAGKDVSLRCIDGEDPAVSRTHSDRLYLEALVATMRDQPDIETRREAPRRSAAAPRAHVRWEEATLFALTQERCDDDDLDAMAADFEEQLPPLAPRKATGGCQPGGSAVIELRGCACYAPCI